MKSLVVYFIVVLAVIGSYSCEEKTRKVSKKKTTDVQFRKEANLWLISQEGDTIKHFDLELAETQKEKNFGMMYRKSVKDNQGMLFLFDHEKIQNFYMKNTFISLDLIFIDKNNEIVSFQKNAEPLNTNSLSSIVPAQFVFEIKGGLSDKIGIKKGDKISWKRQ